MDKFSMNEIVSCEDYEIVLPKRVLFSAVLWFVIFIGALIFSSIRFASNSESTTNLFILLISISMIISIGVVGLHYGLRGLKTYKHCKEIYTTGEFIKARIVSVDSRTVNIKMMEDSNKYMIDYEFEYEGQRLRKKTSYVFYKADVNYYNEIGSFNIVYSKKKDEAVYVR